MLYRAVCAGRACGDIAHVDRLTVIAQGPGLAIRSTDEPVPIATFGRSKPAGAVLGTNGCSAHIAILDVVSEGHGNLMDKLLARCGVGRRLIVLLRTVGVGVVVVLITIVGIVLVFIVAIVVAVVTIGIVALVIVVVLVAVLATVLVVVRCLARSTITKERSGALTLVALARGLAFHRLSRHGEVHILAFDGLALPRAVDIGDEHRWEAIESVTTSDGFLFLGAALASVAASNGDLGAVHIHLAVTDFVEPSPSEQGFSRRSALRNLELILLREGTAAEHGVDDFETLALVVGETDLAGATIVRRAAFQLQAVLLTGTVVGDGLERVVGVPLTRVIAATV